MSTFENSHNPKIQNTKESTKKCEGATQAENTHLKITSIIVRVTKANIRRTKREFEITHDVRNSNNYVYVMPKIKTVKLFQTTKLAGAVFDVEGALDGLL